MSRPLTTLTPNPLLEGEGSNLLSLRERIEVRVG